jgi:tetratricopeptide (TPR) repeat protein
MALNFLTFDKKSSRRSFWFFLNPFHGELKLRDGSLREIREKTARPPDLIRRHGLARVIAFYDSRLFPALKKLPADREVWRARYELGCQAVQMAAVGRLHQKVIGLISTLIVDLPSAHFDDDPKINVAERKKIKTLLAHPLSESAEWMRRRGRKKEAIQAYEMLERLGCLQPTELKSYASLLWENQDRSRSAVHVYLRCLCDEGWDSPTLPKGMVEFVSDQLIIDEESCGEEIQARLLSNQSVLCNPRSPRKALRHAGLAYLRLKQPHRALDYLKRAESLLSPEGGVTSFYLGQALFHIKEFKEAAEAFERARTFGYSRSRIASWQGVAYAKAGEWENALASFRSAEQEEAAALDSDFYFQWGRASFLMKDLQEAMAKFHLALGKDEESWRAACGVAICLELLNRRVEAIDLLEATTKRLSKVAAPFHLLGRLLHEENRKREALECFRKAVSLSPKDPESLLSLGLALDDLGDPECFPVFELAAEGGAGGAEVVRRITLGYFNQHNRSRARRWLEILASGEGCTGAVLLWRARDQASQATEFFNARDYRSAIPLWEGIAAAFPNDPRATQRWALSLLFDAATRLTTGRIDGLWKQIADAYHLFPSPEVQFLYAISRLVEGDAENARQLFSSLREAFPHRSEYQFFSGLADYAAGEEGALERVRGISLGMDDAKIGSLLALFQVTISVGRGAFEKGAEAIKAWIENPGAIQALNLPRYQVNVLVAFGLMRGIRQKKQRIVRWLEEMNAKSEGGYWDPAVAFVKHQIAAGGGIEKAASAELSKLKEAEKAYQGLLQKEGSEEGRQILLGEYGALLQLLICHQVGVGQIGGALETLDRLVGLKISIPDELQKLRRLLAEKMAQPSHEKAYALLSGNPDGAREVWRMLLEKNQNDFTPPEHLACLAWSRAYDEVIAGRFEGSLVFWKEGLDWYQRLFACEAYWQRLREKGRKLGEMPGHPFDEHAFEAWRREALFLVARTLLDLIFHLMADFDGKEEGDPIRTAQSIMEIIRNSHMNEEVKEKLGEDLADQYLDPDPTNLPDFNGTIRRAKRVVDIDPQNFKGRSFLIKATTHHIDVGRREGEKGFSQMFERLTDVERHADWLESRLDDLAPELRERAKNDLAAFYEQKGAVKHDEGQQEIGYANEAGRRGDVQAVRRHLTRTRQCYRESDEAYQRSLAFDPVNVNARDLMKLHQKEYESIGDFLAKVPPY